MPVHVCYVVSPSFIEKHPTVPKDLNESQREAVELWNGNKAKAVEMRGDDPHPFNGKLFELNKYATSWWA